MEPSTRTLAPITSTNEAKASMSTASSTASTTSDSPSKSPLWRLPPDVLTNLQPSYWTRRSSHGPPDGGPAGAVPPAGFVLGQNKFPVPMRRELRRKPLNQPSNCEPIAALGGPDEQNSPVFSQLASREFGFRDGFARDCLLQQRVQCEPDFLSLACSTATGASTGFLSADSRRMSAPSTVCLNAFCPR